MGGPGPGTGAESADLIIMDDAIREAVASSDDRICVVFNSAKRRSTGGGRQGRQCGPSDATTARDAVQLHRRRIPHPHAPGRFIPVHCRTALSLRRSSTQSPTPTRRLSLDLAGAYGLVAYRVDTVQPVLESKDPLDNSVARRPRNRKLTGPPICCSRYLQQRAAPDTSSSHIVVLTNVSRPAALAR